jgi:hypothetical protein
MHTFAHGTVPGKPVNSTAELHPHAQTLEGSEVFLLNSAQLAGHDGFETAPTFIA